MLRRKSVLRGVPALALLGAACAPAQAQTLPTGGAYVAGSGSIASSGAATTITQSSLRGIIDWHSFSIGAGNTVTFNNGTGATLNRVTGGSLSAIEGKLNATGSVYLINPNGVVIGPNGSVAAGGSFVASTRDISNSQFMAGGSLAFSGTSAGTVVNEGKIVSENGDVVLIGAAVTNSGSIRAANGTAALAAGSKVVLSAEDGPAGVYVVPDEGSKGDATNTGRIKAAAADLTSAGGNVYALAGNRTGLIQATGTKNIDGQVWLMAPNGTVSVDGTTVAAAKASGAGGTIVADGKDVGIGATAILSASATKGAQAGGTVLVGVSAAGGKDEATSTAVASGARIAAKGKGGGTGGYVETSGKILSIGAATVDAGAGGTWLLDPENLTIDANAASTIAGTLNGGSTVIEETTASTASGAGTASSGQGDIVVAAPITWSGTGTLELAAYNDIDINAAITASGGGRLALDYGDYAETSAARSGTGVNYAGGSIQFATQNQGALTVNGQAYTLAWDLGTLASDIASNASGHYALAKSINAGGTYTASPVTTTLTGTFDGLGNTISGLTINDTTGSSYVGLFGQIGAGATVKNIGLTNASITSSGNGSYVGTLAGLSLGAISHVYATGTVAGSSGSYTGGLVGVNHTTGTITDAYATDTVSDATGSAVGGLAGGNWSATITQSYATGDVTGGGFAGGLVGGNSGTISNAYATGAVSSSSANAQVGGLVGNEVYIITDSYATGSVTGTGAGAEVGGLAGYNTSTIKDAYATGTVSGTGLNAQVGGLVGNDIGGTYTDNYWNTTTNAAGTAGIGNASSSGVTGLTTQEWLTGGPTVSGSANSFANASAWVAGSPYPVLAALPYIVIDATSTQTYGNAASITGTIASATDQNGHDASALLDTGGLAWITTATSASNVGTYILGGSGAAATGYQIAYRGTAAVVAPTSTSASTVFPQTVFWPTPDLIGNKLGPLPIIDTAAAAGLATDADTVTVSTGLPLAATAGQARIDAGQNRRLRIDLPSNPFAIRLGGPF
jgi:filamentous hemagglutinin family protein